MDNKDILLKVKKLLALANNSGSYEGEAANAFLKAQELMVKHNLTMEEVTEDQKPAEAKADYSVSKGSNTAWKVALAKILADNFKCEVLKCGSGFCFIGMAEEVQLTISLFNLASDIMDKGMKKVRRDARKQGRITDGLAGDYVHGFLDGLKAKFAEQVEREGWGLILVKPDAVVQKTQALATGKPKQVKDQLGRRGDMAAYQKGYKEGKNLQSQKQITA